MPDTQPLNNFDAFKGDDRMMWMGVARGHGFPARDTGEQKIDVDGLVVQNGGMFAPREETLHDRALYHRFISTAGATSDRKNAWAGGWWVTDATMSYMLGIAKTGTPLSTVAQNYLAVPNEWSDCAFVVTARLEVKLKAWVGKGKTAHGIHSPDINGGLTSDRPRGFLYAAPPHLAPIQLLVPGAPDDLARWFTKLHMQSARG